MPTTIGYLRVSTPDQDVEKNKADILHFANDQNFGKVQWVTETAGGFFAGSLRVRCLRMFTGLRRAPRMNIERVKNFKCMAQGKHPTYPILPT